jgi:glutamate-ammonia-ligase adenylyltransferase
MRIRKSNRRIANWSSHRIFVKLLMTGQDFSSELFSDPARANRHLVVLHEAFIRSGSHYTLDEFSSALRQHVGASSDPDMLLTNLVRYEEASVSRASFFNDFIHYPIVAELLAKIFGTSQYFADILVREPEVFRWLTASDALTEEVKQPHLRAEADRIEQTFQRPERRLDALKRLYRRELLRIGAQDLLGVADLVRTTRQLSVLADVLVDAALRVAVAQLSERYPVRPDTTMAVIGLGKLGGGELNYSSDIDIMFVYGEEGDIGEETGTSVEKTGSAKKRGEKRVETGTLKRTYHEYFNKLAERLVQNLSQPSAEGHLYRVDTRLRPESGAGPLARSLRSFMVYYESRGELWERQMLIKARPIAGDLDLGREFVRQMEPFVYPRTFLLHPAEYVARIKARIEVAVRGEDNIKLMSGGIRDIEFVVQTLQLLNGGTRPGLRSGNTLLALAAIGADGLLPDDEVRDLGEAYRFYRTLEHRLQAMLNTQTHIVPQDERMLEALSKRLGLGSAAELRAANARYLTRVQSVFARVLSVKETKAEKGILSVIEGGLPEEVLYEILGSLKFTDVRLALRHLRTLTSGSSLTGTRDLDARTRDAFRAIAPDLFSDLAATPDPDLTLAGLTSIVAAQKIPDAIYRQLADGKFRRFILDICKISPRFARGLARSPLLLDSFAGDIAALTEEPVLSLAGGEDLLEFKQTQELRSGIRYLLGFADFPALTSELAQLADFVIARVLEEESRKARFRTVPLAVFALGKYGTRELNFDADLDLLFVAQSCTARDAGRVENLAGAFLRRLSSVAEGERLYEADARLRPEGKSAPLVVNIEAYGRYLVERASLWERQSLTRVRFVGGDQSVAEEVRAILETVVYHAPLPAGWVEYAVAMRKRMETRTRFRGPAPLDIKLGAGGMADIEFLVQMLQLRYGGSLPGIRSRRVDEVLAAPEVDVLSEDERLSLRGTYQFYRRVETLLRITLEERGTILPEGKKMETLARCLDGSGEQALKVRLTGAMNETRKLFHGLSRRIAS